jgi:hypothetical protein
MGSILRTASYVRAGHAPPHLVDDDFAILREPVLEIDGGQRIWELLETPQTIETLCRALHVDALPDPPACGRAVESILIRLYERDLIEVTADS